MERRAINLILLMVVWTTLAEGAVTTPIITSCEYLRAPTNGYRYPSSTGGRDGELPISSTVRFRCRSGYKLLGVRKVHCKPNYDRTSSPVLNAPVPLCVPRSAVKRPAKHIISKRSTGCVDFGNPQNGVRVLSDGSTSSGSRVIFQCNTGYQLQGSSNLTCQLGSWDGGVWPRCAFIEKVTCGDPGRPIFNLIGRRFVEGTTEGSKVTYSCQAGFALVGDSVRTCLSTGQWSGQIPRCKDVNCGIPRAPANGKVSATFFGFGYTATYTCDPGHVLDGERVVTCLKNCSWSSGPPNCIAKQCQDLQDPPNGCVSHSSYPVYGSMAVYKCDSGYGLVGSGTRQCMADGSWSGTAPTCQRGRCDQLDDPENGTVTLTGYYTNDIATYDCFHGYHLIMRTRTRRCQESGRWTHATPTCRPASCSRSIVPLNAVVTKTNGDYVYSVATFTCKEGHRLHGPAYRRCEPSGVWNTSYHAICIPISCDLLRPPKNGNVSFSDRNCYRSEAVFSCNQGYSLRGGDEIVTCQQNQRWSGTIPFCSRDPVPCLPLGGIPNGSVSVTGPGQPGELATYNCNTGFTLNGARERICRDDGVWSGQEPFCTRVVVVTCEELETPQFGFISSNGSQVYSRVEYSCRSGYLLSGDSTRTCLDTGIWSGTAPTCDPVDCGIPDAPSNGNVTIVMTTLGSLATYTCGSLFRIIGSSIRQCMEDGEWSGLAPTCEEIRCGDLGDPENGEVDLSRGDTVGAVARYTCDPAHILVGMETRECQEDGMWSGVSPICEAVDCGDLDSPVNGSVDLLQGSSFGDVANYSCDPLFILVGVSTRTCLDNGQWSGEAPVCEEIMCQVLDDPEFGTVSYQGRGQAVDGVAVYDCLMRYSLIGQETRSCLDNGEWSGVAPTCELLECQQLESPPNGMVTIADNVPGSQAIYSCISGYMLDGPGNRTCQRTSGRIVEWSGTAPSCTPVMCPEPEVPVNGTLRTPPPYPVNATAVYVCDAGFESNRGSIRRTCRSDGTWTDSPPNCVRSRVFCPMLDRPMFGDISFQGDRSLESTVTYVCDPGYQINGEAERVCQLNGLIGEWSGTPPTCEAVMCPELVPPVDGDIRLINANGSLVRGAEVIYFCNEGFLVNGQLRRVCLTSGDWSGSDTFCTPQPGTVSCGRLDNPERGRVDLSSSTPNSVATYSCDLGYMLVGGAIQRRCLDNGTWEGLQPMCEVVGCGPLSDPPNGAVFVPMDTTRGAIATYVCNPGYELIGLESGVRNCTVRGEWSETDPTCERVDCGPLPPPVNGIVDQERGTRFMDVTMYSCVQGYVLTPSEFKTRICTETGDWSGSRPTCELRASTVDCGNLPPLENGQVVLLNSSTGRFSLAEYSCNEGFILDGVSNDNSLRQCQNNGEWSGAAPTCIRRECPELEAPANGRLFSEGQQVGSSATYICNPGFQLVGLLRRVCQTNGRWTGDDTRCERIINFTQTRRSIHSEGDKEQPKFHQNIHPK